MAVGNEVPSGVRHCWGPEAKTPKHVDNTSLY